MDNAAGGAAVALLDARGRITWCDPAFGRLVACAPVDARMRSFGHLLEAVIAAGADAHADAAARTPWRPALSAGRRFCGDIRVVSADGHTRRLALQLEPQRHGSGGLDGFVALVGDTTAPVEPVDDGQRLRDLLNLAGAGLWRSNVQTGHSTVDARWAQIGGRDVAELATITLRDWMALVHPADASRLKAEQRRHALHEQQHFALDCRMRHAHGHWVWVAVRGVITSRTASGQPEWMHGTLQDITAAKRGDEELQLANSKLQALFELSPVGIALSDVGEGRFLEFNESLLAMTGYARDELALLRHRDICPPEHRAEVGRQREHLRIAGRYGPVHTALIHKQGHNVDVQVTGIRMSLADGSERVWSLVQNLDVQQRIEQRLRAEARTDEITGLPNRVVLMERLAASVERAQADPASGFTLLLIDFDRFKLVNERLGPDAGDQLLRLIAERMRDTLRTSDVMGSTSAGRTGNVMARFGADEFVILLHDVKTAADAGRVADRLLHIFAAPYVVKNEELHSSASIGVVLADQSCQSAATVLRNADMARHEAKRAGRSTVAFFDPEMLQRLTHAVRIEAALRRAIQLDQLSVVYQPIVNLETGQVTSAEALVRWHHPELGQVSPNEFIPIAEQTGLIVDIGEWVLWEACRQWKRWQEVAPDRAPETISVNVSRVQMSQPERLLERVAAVLAETGMKPHQLQIEVTEREVMRDPESARQLMEALRAMGVRLAMDDFGTGTSSLGCLRDYPFDVIKIDKSFIDCVSSKPETLAVIHATVSVVESLGMVSVAEGIEQEMQVGILQSLGCRYGQGYFFARPVTGDRLIGAVRVREACD